MTEKKVKMETEISSVRRRRPPATTSEGREQEMIALAFDVAERQMREGTASAQVITHFLKFGSSQNKLEQEKLRKENLLRQAQVEQISANAQNNVSYENAIKMMKIYTGESSEESDE